MSKKKGQKWGMNNSSKKYVDIGAGSSTETNHHFIDRKITENGFCAVSNQKDDESSNIKRPSVNAIAKEKFIDEPLDFESLYPLTRLPKVFLSIELGYEAADCIPCSAII
jgi:coilin